MATELISLNVSQRKAVEEDRSHVLVKAGPGSGKTRVIACRIDHIIEKSKDENFKILGLAFTEKACKEMQQRVSSMIHDEDRRINITTFHSFGVKLLHQHGHLLGIDSDFATLVKNDERMDLLKEAVKSSGQSCTNTQTYDELLYSITKLMQEGIAPESAIDELKNKNIRDAEMKGIVYEHYRKLMIENKILDFDGILAETLKLLTTTPVGSLIKRIYRHVCVDEFQDTNTVQYEILRNIIDPEKGKLFVVADSNQNIYGWNGAKPGILESLKNEFNMDVLELPENYRCPPSIINVANKLIAKNPNHHGTNSISHQQDDTNNVIRVKAFDTSEDESEWIASDIAQRTTEEQHACTILARSRGHLKMIVEKLNAQGVKSHLAGRKDEFTNNQIAWLHMMLRLANARQNRKYLNSACGLFSSIKDIDLNSDNIVSEAMTSDNDYLHTLLRTVCREQIDDNTKLFLENVSKGLADRLDVNKFIEDSFEWFEILLKDTSPENTTVYKEEKNVFNKIVHQVENGIESEQITLNSILQKIDHSSKESISPENTVMCYTIHASKGMEFDHVYLTGFSEGILPSWQAIEKGDQSQDMQEERRICFVAITRAQKSLTLTYPLKISNYVKKPSRFLNEMELMDQSS